MARSDTKTVEPGGFIKYGPENLPKVDSLRRDKSQPDFYGVPIITDGQALFTRASELGNKPASCYTCEKQQSDLTCYQMGSTIKVAKFTGHRDSGEPIEYWPCCGQHKYGEPAKGKPSYAVHKDNPRSLGLVWINASKVGQEYGGANCGGVEGGDDCDHYIVDGKEEKWDVEQGVCRVLQHSVDGGDVCAVWHDDDELNFEETQQMIQGRKLGEVQKGRLARQIIGRSDSEK